MQETSKNRMINNYCNLAFTLFPNYLINTLWALRVKINVYFLALLSLILDSYEEQFFQAYESSSTSELLMIESGVKIPFHIFLKR